MARNKKQKLRVHRAHAVNKDGEPRRSNAPREEGSFVVGYNNKRATSVKRGRVRPHREGR